MAHGSPDWNKYRPSSITYSVQDMGELAARLGSPVVFSRQGDVIWMDTFAQGVNRWYHDAPLHSGTVVPSPTTYLSDGYSCKLTPEAKAGYNVAIATWLPYPAQGNNALEFAFTLAAAHSKLDVTLDVYTGSLYLYYNVRYTVATKTLSYKPATPGLTDLTPTLAIYKSPQTFNHIKIVIDPFTGNYKRIHLNQETWPINAPGVITADTTSNPRIYITIYAFATDDTQPVMYIDNAILTQDEP